jgi:predicted DCC family thiol-disulfide oxidoreductase YuxK
MGNLPRRSSIPPPICLANPTASGRRHGSRSGHGLPDLLHKVNATNARPTLIFDGECRFCRRWVARWRRQTGYRVHYVPYQKVGGRFPQLRREDFENAIQFVNPDGSARSGADAVTRLHDYGLWGGHSFGALLSIPPIIWILRLGYRFVARHRSFFSALERRRKRKGTARRRAEA